MIDQGFCFNAGEWNFPDAPLRGLYARNRVYEGVIGRESFAPRLQRLEQDVTERVLERSCAKFHPAGMTMIWIQYGRWGKSCCAGVSWFRTCSSRRKIPPGILFLIGFRK
jgi:hypothetical protein